MSRNKQAWSAICGRTSLDESSVRPASQPSENLRKLSASFLAPPAQTICDQVPGPQELHYPGHRLLACNVACIHHPRAHAHGVKNPSELFAIGHAYSRHRLQQRGDAGVHSRSNEKVTLPDDVL